MLFRGQLMRYRRTAEQLFCWATVCTSASRACQSLYCCVCR